MYNIREAYKVIKKEVPEVQYNSLRELIRFYKLNSKIPKKSRVDKVLIKEEHIENIIDYYKTVFDKRKLRATFKEEIGKIKLRKKEAIRNLKGLKK